MDFSSEKLSFYENNQIFTNSISLQNKVLLVSVSNTFTSLLCIHPFLNISKLICKANHSSSTVWVVIIRLLTKKPLEPTKRKNEKNEEVIPRSKQVVIILNNHQFHVVMMPIIYDARSCLLLPKTYFIWFLIQSYYSLTYSDKLFVLESTNSSKDISEPPQGDVLIGNLKYHF